MTLPLWTDSNELKKITLTYDGMVKKYKQRYSII